MSYIFVTPDLVRREIKGIWHNSSNDIEHPQKRAQDKLTDVTLLERFDSRFPAWPWRLSHGVTLFFLRLLDTICNCDIFPENSFLHLPLRHSRTQSSLQNHICAARDTVLMNLQ